MNKKQKIAGAAAAATMTALVLAPASGWLVRNELLIASSGLFHKQTAFLYPHRWNNQDRAASAALIARQNRGDVRIQIAARQAMLPPLPDNQSTSGTRRAHALFPLLETYGNSPALHATILRFLSQDSVQIEGRDQTSILQNTPPPKPGDDTPDYIHEKPNPNTNRPEDLAAWDASCASGEKIDPQNAYFPLMRSVGFFAAHRDKEAIAALRRAGEKTEYNEYTADETEGQWAMNRQIQGKAGFVADMTVSAAQLFPHYAAMRAAARLATTDAILSEMAGDTEGGYQTRRAVTRVGALMQRGSKPFIGTLVGRAIGFIALSRPGGALPLPKLSSSDRAVQDARARENVNRYAAYLEKNGHGAAAAEARTNYESSEKSRGLWQRAANNPDNVLDMQPVLRLVGLWAAGVGLLTNVFSLLILGGLFTLFARNRRVRGGLPMSKAARNGMACGLVLPACGLLVAVTWPEPVSLAVLACAASVLALAAFRAVRPKIAKTMQTEPSAQEPTNGAFWKSLGATLAVFAGFGIVGSMGAVQTFQAGNDLMSGNSHVSPLVLGLLGAAVSSAVSLLLLIGLSITSRVKRVPVSVGVARGFRRFALPISCALVLLYAGVVSQTVRSEARATAAMHEIVANGEVAYLSRLLHEPPISWYAAEPNKTFPKIITKDTAK